MCFAAATVRSPGTQRCDPECGIGDAARNRPLGWFSAADRLHSRHGSGTGHRHAALFGSVVRGEARPSSDIDLLIELDPEAPIGVFEYVELTDFIGGLFPVRVDIANRAKLKSYVRPQAEREAVQAF